METRARLHPDVQIVAPRAGSSIDSDELREDELEMAVGGLERAWIPRAASDSRFDSIHP